MNQVYLWSLTVVTALISLSTLWKLWSERACLSKENLDDNDRAFAWRIVIFVIFPLANWLDLRATITSCELAGGYVRSWDFGFLWSQVTPAGLHSAKLLIPVLFSGTVAEIAFALCLLPALLFRPHPFLATVIGYTTGFLLGINLIADPLLSAIGPDASRWQLAFTHGDPQQRMWLIGINLALIVAYILLLRNYRLRLWFSDLTRPHASDELKNAIALFSENPDSANIACRVGLLYESAGLRRQAKKQLALIKKTFGSSIYAQFLESIILYRKREYKLAHRSFLYTSDFPGVDGELKASLLAAAACAAFAEGDITAALNLSERALEFDHQCLVARMVKVDVFLRQGKKDQAGEEILSAMQMDLALDLENKIPLDTEVVYGYLSKLDQAMVKSNSQMIHSSK